MHGEENLSHRDLQEFIFVFRDSPCIFRRPEGFLVPGFGFIDDRVQDVFFALEMLIK